MARMANPLLRPFHLAAISLVLLALAHHTSAATTSTSISLPPRASALPTGPRDDDAPSTAAAATGRALLRAPAFSDRVHAPPTTLQPDGGSSAPRGLLAAPAPSPQAAFAPLRPRPRAAARGHYYAYTSYGATLADLHYACRPPLCFAESDHDLLLVLYGPRAGGRWQWHDESAYSVVRTIEGTPPIMPDSWRAYIYSGGDVCHVEVGYVNVYDGLSDCPAWTCERHFTTSADEALAWAISAISTPCGGSTSSAAVAASPRNAIALLLPLLAVVPFLPPPLAAAVALSSLASLVLAAGADDLSAAEEHIKVNHATCSVYKYDNATGAVERARPYDGLRVVCPRPLCIDADYDERTLWVAYAYGQRSHGGRRDDDPLRVYCTVHSLEGAASPSVFFPWRNTWRTHLPVRVADIADHVCYVELAHMDYREGYYIRCPAATIDGYAHVSCMEFPDEPVASAVWEHRRLTYRDTVGPECERYKFGASASGQFWAHDYDADL